MSIFDKYAAIDALRAGQLALAAVNYPALAAISDDLLWQKLQEAEREVSRRLGISLEPIEVFTEPPTAQELIDLQDVPYRLEPGYELSPGFFAPEHWGILQLSQKPVIAVHQVTLVYPLFHSQPIAIPPDWVRLNAKYGQLHIVPSTLQGSSTLALFLASNFLNGNTLPNMIRVRYRAGLDTSSGLYLDVLGIVQRMAVMRLLHDAFLPSSSSISADGLSQTIAMTTAAVQAQLNEQLDALKQQLTGMVWDVL